MSLAIKQYVIQPNPIEAVLITHENIAEAALWCGGEVTSRAKPGDPEDVYEYLTYPQIHGTSRVGVGDYLIKSRMNGRFAHSVAATFEQNYKQLGSR